MLRCLTRTKTLLNNILTKVFSSGDVACFQVYEVGELSKGGQLMVQSRVWSLRAQKTTIPKP